ncbi:hypothetical protein CB1_000292014 [Camelus ferus]|nr:hypothetical protein CB1_000292014 [Camelus ferus]
MMINFVVHRNTISYHWCATQLAFFEVFIITELFILSAMAYDRYVAICKPLLHDFPNSYMAPRNFSQVTEFILTGISDRPDLQIPLFSVFLGVYGLTMAGNLTIITLTSVDSRLQTPMYFFLRQRATINLGNSTVIAPKMPINFLVKKRTTSYYE